MAVGGLATDVQVIDMSDYCCFSFYLKQKNGKDDIIKKFFNEAGLPAPDTKVEKMNIPEVEGKSSSLAEFSNKIVDELSKSKLIEGYGFHYNEDNVNAGKISRNNGFRLGEEFESISDGSRLAAFYRGYGKEDVFIDLDREYKVSSNDKLTENGYEYTDKLEIFGYLKEEDLPKLFDFVRYSNVLKDFELVPRMDVELSKHSHEVFEEYTKKANEFDNHFTEVANNGVKVHLAVPFDKIDFDASVQADISSDLSRKLYHIADMETSSRYTREDVQKELIALAPELNKIKNGLVLDEVSANKFSQYTLDSHEESGCCYQAFVSSVYNIPGLFRIKDGVDGEYDTKFVLVDGVKFNEKYGNRMEKVGTKGKKKVYDLSIDSNSVVNSNSLKR